MHRVPACVLAAFVLAGCHANNASPAQNAPAPAPNSVPSPLPDYTPPFVNNGPHKFPTVPAQKPATPPPSAIELEADQTDADFEATNAFRYLKKQCAFGFRIPNTDAHEKCKRFIVDELRADTNTVITTPFTFHDKDRKVTLRLTNILAAFGPKDARKVMIFTHWDTRPTADQELLPEDKKKPILGADDGASGTAVLLELARILKKAPPKVRVELLFVDGEDWGPTEDKMYLGSLEFVRKPGAYKPTEAILLDMVGDTNLQIHREVFSETYAKDLDDRVWKAASALGFQNFFLPDAKWSISDDHLPFNRAGIPAVDVIDFDYPYWHTVSDTVDKCSPSSLKIVGDVCAKFLADAR